MAHDVYLVVASPAAEAIVLRRWLGGNTVSDLALALLKRDPEVNGTGERAWVVHPEEALAISSAHYHGGATPAEVRGWAAKFPSERFWWTVFDSF